MAEAMQGIMALQGAPDMSGQAAPQLNVTPEQMAAFESARGQIDPAEFGSELLRAGEQIDPVELKSLRDMLKQANLSPQILDAIGQLVDTVLAEPEKYQEIRAKFLAEGVPEDLLPEQFDAEFFAALNLALDQVNTSFPQDNPMQGGIASMPMGAAMPMVEPQAFALGGLASLKPIPAGLAQMGRNGDTMLAHITPSEARLLRRRGGSGTVNPATGLPEFFLDKVFKSVGNAFKSVGKAVVSGVKAVAKGVKSFAKSTVGRVVIAVALAYFLGPAAASFLGVTSTVGVAAVGGFIGGFGSTLAAGKGFKEALKVGAIGGVGAGIGAGVIGGASAFSAGSYAGPTTVAGQWDSLVSGAKNLVGATPPTTAGNIDLGSYADMAPATTLSPPASVPTTGVQALPVPNTPLLPGTTDLTPLPMPSPGPLPTSSVDLNNLNYQPSSFSGQGNVAGVGNYPGSYTPGEVSYGSTATTAPVATPDYTTSGVDTGGAMGVDPTGGYGPAAGSGAPTTPGGAPSFMDRVTTGAKDIFGKFMPSSSDPAELLSQATQKADLAIANNPALAGSRNALITAYAKPPSMLSNYGPLALGALGLTAASGGFKQQPVEQPNITGGRTGEQLLEQDPAKYRPFFGGVRRVQSTPTTYYTPSNYQTAVSPVAPVSTFAKGGITSLDGYPKKQGAINGAGTGTSDSIKALLSDGEFVFTAKAVRGAGQGSRRKGAKRMYQLMRSLEGKA